MQLSEFVRNVCRPYGELILKSWEWTGWRWNLESWKNRSRSWKGPLNFVFEKRYETCNQANVHFRATLSTIFYQTWLVVYQTPTVVLKRNPSETSWGMKIYRMNLYNNLLRYCNRNCILKYKSQDRSDHLRSYRGTLGVERGSPPENVFAVLFTPPQVVIFLSSSSWTVLLYTLSNLFFFFYYITGTCCPLSRKIVNLRALWKNCVTDSEQLSKCAVCIAQKI